MNDARLALFRDAMARKGLSAFYMRNESDIRWITGFDGVFDGEGAFALLVLPDCALLHTDSRYALATTAAAEHSPFTVSVKPASHAAVALEAFALYGQSRSRCSGRTLPANSAAPALIGLESSLTLGEYRALQKAAREQSNSGCEVDFAETDGLCIALRAVKDADEIARMKAAQAITDAAFAHIIEYLRPGMTERQVQVELEEYMVRHGAAGLAFASIVATGAHGASPHALSDDTRLQAGQCVVMDFGARALGYCSDMTRVVFLGEPTEAMRCAYAVLREANETIEAMLAPGMTGAQAHAKAEEILSKGGFAGKMGHSLGHGVGLDIHEQPNLSLRNESPLVAGNVVTVEPGIYLEGEFGMRLEDFGVITETGFQVFTQSTHEMVII